MNRNQAINETSASVLNELTFLTRHTGQEEGELLTRALHLGLNLLYQQAMEQAFIDGAVTREDAIAALGHERVEELEYARQALAQDIARGLGL